MTIYLDHAATTPVDARVAARMAAVLADPQAQANPASATHGPGLRAGDTVEEARRQVARLIGAEPREIIFTSGATEANNLAILGVAAAARRARAREPGRPQGHFVSSRVEHKSVLDPLRQLEKEGFAVTLLEPDETGRVPPEAVDAAMRADTLLVTLMLANNEIGVLNDVAAIGRRVRSRGVLLHTDASQAVGKLPVDVEALNVDFLALTAHKFYGPKGVGALYVREAARPRIAPIQFGGGHERGLRSGTLPTHQLVGLGEAAALASEALAHDMAHARDLTARLWRELEGIPGVELNSRADGAPGILNVSFPGIEGESLITALTDIAVSTGSACSSASREPSYVLRALGRDTELAQSSLRISLGRGTTAADVDVAATAIRSQVTRLRQLAGSEGAAASVPDAMPRVPPGSLLGRLLNETSRRYFLAPPRAPRFHDGDLPEGVRHGRAGRQAEGAHVLFELEIGGGFVKSARFSAYGCPHTLAVTSWLCEVSEGRRIDAGPPGTPVEWAEKFQVPAEKLGRLLVVEDALRAAFGS
ncbi:MAG TPA: aminotransferase class V-fold PLP-dependent enzyme [Steroidobacteraceae bacterium]